METFTTYSIYPSVLWGFASLAVLWVAMGVFGGTWSPVRLILGADNRPSTSKFQWLIWTAVVFFSYVVIYATRARDGIYEPITTIPANVLYAMGFSVMTMAAAKGLKVSYINSDRIADDKTTDPKEQTVGKLLTDDNSIPDLSKMQMVGWTILACAVYLIRTFQAVRQFTTGDTDLAELPDIDGALMVLMGISQGGYLGKKATTMETKRPDVPPPPKRNGREE